MSILSKTQYVLAAIVATYTSISSPLSKDADEIDMTPARDVPVVTSEASVDVGHTFQIKFRSNAGLAYWWQCASADESVADVKDLGTKRADGLNDGRVGFPITWNFMISPLSSGNTTIKCEFVALNKPVVSTLDLILRIR